jgi:tetraacyldisaccharide 4'-kinase
VGFKTEISKLHYDKKAKGSLFNILKFCSNFYGIGSLAKNVLYDKSILKPKKADAYVLSVGNLTTGGVGKTPVVAKIAQYYIDKGEKVAIVSRGYGGKLSNKNINVISDGEKTFFSAELGGDEPVWLSENVKGACVITSKNRYKASKYAIEKFGATKIILDDGFQHRKLHRDLDIVLIDSEMGFGNESLLPAGPLREGLEAFNRIDKLVIVSKNTDHTRAEKYAKIMGKKLKKHAVVCYTEPDVACNILEPEQHLQNGEKAIAFSAIGQPQQFYRFLNEYEVAKTVDFDDHHKYAQADADKLVQACKDLNINNLITTEKDAVKFIGLNTNGVKVFALKLQTKLDVETLLNENSN